MQILRQEEASRHLPLITLSREALLERHRQLGLAAPLTAPGSAPHAAARRLWMRFRWGGGAGGQGGDAMGSTERAGAAR